MYVSCFVRVHDLHRWFQTFYTLNQPILLKSRLSLLSARWVFLKSKNNFWCRKREGRNSYYFYYLLKWKYFLEWAYYTSTCKPYCSERLYMYMYNVIQCKIQMGTPLLNLKSIKQTFIWCGLHTNSLNYYLILL